MTVLHSAFEFLEEMTESELQMYEQIIEKRTGGELSDKVPHDHDDVKSKRATSQDGYFDDNRYTTNADNNDRNLLRKNDRFCMSNLEDEQEDLDMLIDDANYVKNKSFWLPKSKDDIIQMNLEFLISGENTIVSQLTMPQRRKGISLQTQRFIKIELLSPSPLQGGKISKGVDNSETISSAGLANSEPSISKPNTLENGFFGTIRNAYYVYDYLDEHGQISFQKERTKLFENLFEWL